MPRLCPICRRVFRFRELLPGLNVGLYVCTEGCNLATWPIYRDGEKLPHLLPQVEEDMDQK